MKVVENWHKRIPIADCIISTEIGSNGHHGSVIFLRKNMAIKAEETVENENNSNEKTLEIVKTMHHVIIFWKNFG